MTIWPYSAGPAADQPKVGAELNPHGRRGKPEEEETALGHNPVPVNPRTAEGILARLKRDHPQIAQAFIEGEYLSAAAAGRAAGISWLQTKSPLEKAQAAFRRLVKEDRDAFDLWRAEQPL